ncbi:MAG: hypothetical protein U5L01_16310 [Rheinheimera sp.]|nr:hypothetical protein [Rheinheimera sp.]
MLYAQNLTNQKLSAESRGQFSNKLLNRLQDLEQQVNDLLLFARAGREQQVAELSMQQLLSEVYSSVEAIVVAQDGHIAVELPWPDLQVLGNHSALTGALANLIQNALQHAGPGAQIDLCAFARSGWQLCSAGCGRSRSRCASSFAAADFRNRFLPHAITAPA